MLNFLRDKKIASLFLMSIMNLLIATNEQDIHIDLVIQLVLARLAITCDLDRSIDTEENNFENIFQSFFNQVILFNKKLKQKKITNVLYL